MLAIFMKSHTKWFEFKIILPNFPLTSVNENSCIDAITKNWLEVMRLVNSFYLVALYLFT